MGVVALVAIGGVALLLRPAPTPALAQAPDFTLPVAWGAASPSSPTGHLSLRALRGHPTVLTFFTPACTGCVQQLPVLHQALQDYRSQGLRVVGIDMGGDSLDTAHAFGQAKGVPFPVVIDAGLGTAQRYQVPADPTTFFLDAQGHIRGQYPGPVDQAAMRNGLAQAGVPMPGGSL